MVAQLQVLNKILDTGDFSIVTSNNLDSRYFSGYKAEFDYIKNHLDRFGNVPDKLTFLGVFPDFDLQEVKEPDNFLLDQLSEDYNRDYLKTRFNAIKGLIEGGKTDEAVDYFLKSVDNLHVGSAISCTNLLTDTSRYDRYLERLADQKKYYLSTGFDELDALIGGIDRENENMVIIARPGVGKTQLLLKLATEASKAGLTVGIYEGEMTTDKVGYRIDTFLGHIKNSSINRGDAYVQKDYKRYIDSLNCNGYGAIKVFTPTDVSGDVTVDTIKSFIEKEHIEIMFVDQYSLIEDKSYAKNDFEHVGNIAKAIKKLQVSKQIPFISVSQMNRTKNEEGNQDTTQVAGSDKIPQYATTVIALEQKQNEEDKSVQLTLNIIKARDGGDHNKLVYRVGFNTGDFTYIPGEDNKLTKEARREQVNSYAVREEQPFC